MKNIHKILLIDDSDDDNYIHKREIKKLGYVDIVDTCSDGVDALEYIKGEGRYRNREQPFAHPDIIFLDINMPKINGWEFLEAFKKLNLSQSITPIVFMLSTSMNPEDKTRAKSDNAIVDFCSKPLTQSNLQEIFEKHFSDDNI